MPIVITVDVDIGDPPSCVVYHFILVPVTNNLLICASLRVSTHIPWDGAPTGGGVEHWAYIVLLDKSVKKNNMYIGRNFKLELVFVIFM